MPSSWHYQCLVYIPESRVYAVYAVWPCAILFLVVYSFATQRLSRAKLFNFIILGFLAFFTSFGLLYPSHEALHFSGFANAAISTLPSGVTSASAQFKADYFSSYLLTAGYSCLQALPVQWGWYATGCSPSSIAQPSSGAMWC